MLLFRLCGKNVFPPNAISLLASMWEHIALRLYVGSLSYQTTEQELADLFGQVGQVVSATVITDRDSGRSKGFGFVEMSNDDEARKAIDQLNGTTLGSRQIIVNEAREKRDNSYGEAATEVVAIIAEVEADVAAHAVATEAVIRVEDTK